MRIVLLCLFLLSPATASAVPAIDQSHIITQGTGGRIIYAGNSPAQTFTAGAAGVLSQVDVLVYRDSGDIGELALEVWPVVAEGPAGSTPLFSTPIDPNDVPTGSAAYVGIDVSAGGLLLLPGERYAIAVNGTADLDAPNAVWAGGFPGYADGGRFDRSGSWAIGSSDFDYGFRTWVDPDFVPGGLSTLELTPTSEWQASLSTTGASVIFTANDTMRVDRTPASDEDARGLIEFDASALPAGATISSAMLEFDINELSQSGSMVPIVDIYGYQATGLPTDSDARNLSRRLGASTPIESFDPVAIRLDAGELSSMLDLSPDIGLVAYQAAANAGVGMVASQLADQFPTIFSAPTLTIAYSVAPQSALPVGDYNGDAHVDAADYTVWRDTLGSTIDLRADGDDDGQVDQDDYHAWTAAYGVGPDAHVQNGDFETGLLLEWDVIIEPNTDVSFGFPRVESFDVDGDGQASDAMRVRLGRSDTSQFGGVVAIEQELLLAAGDYELSADVASQSLQEFGNTGPGNYELTFDGVIVDQVLLNGTSIGGFEVIRDHLHATLTDVQAGYHTLRLAVARGATNSRPIYQFIDNIEITPLGPAPGQAVPEPAAGAMLAVVLGLAAAHHAAVSRLAM